MSVILLKEKLIQIAKNNISHNDISHDIYHSLRVLKNAEYISMNEGGDKEIIIPACLFHDIVKYPIDNSKRKLSQLHSSQKTKELLHECKFYPQNKIKYVQLCIEECSFTNNTKATTLESMILQDADLLESSGAISIMRTFASVAQLKNPFYNAADPFCCNREPNDKKYGLDLFYTRLLNVKNHLNTTSAVDLIQERENFLKLFIKQLELELL